MEESIEQQKAREYEQLREQFVNGEISEQQMEAEMDQLFESGEDFLQYDKVDDSVDMTGELAFRVREIGQIAVTFVVLMVATYLVLMTKGAVLPLLVVTSIIAYIAYLRWKRKI